MQLTDELKVVVAAEVDRAIRSFEQLNSSVDKSEKKTRSLGDAIDKISGKAAIVSTALAGTGIAAVKLAGDLEQTQLALEVLLGDAAQATQIKNEWTQLAASTPFSSIDIDSAGKKLLAFNIEAEKVTDTLRRIGDISAATGSSISEIADIYGKAAVQGRLFAEDINQFQGRGIPVIQSLAEVLGVAETEVRDLVTQGKVGFLELEAAFKAMTDEGGQFSGMMEKLSTSTLGRFSSVMDNAELAIASFGSVMLDTVNDVLDAGDDFFQWLQDVADGTKRFVVTFAGVGAGVAGAVAAVNAMTRALAALAANPVILGAAAVAAGIGLVAAAANKAAHRFEDTAAEIAKVNGRQKELLASFADGDAAKKLDAETTDRLILLYPELAGEISAYATTVSEAADAVERLNGQKILDAVAPEIEKLKKLNEELAALPDEKESKIEIRLEEVDRFAFFNPEFDAAAAAEVNLKEIEQAFAEKGRKLSDKIDERVAEINDSLRPFGKMLSDTFAVIDIPDVTVTAGETDTSAVTESLRRSLGTQTEDVRKTWQEWFREVTGVEGAFSTGEEAGRLYAEGLADGAADKAALSGLLGLDAGGSQEIRAQMQKVADDIGKLLAVPAEKIDEKFSLADASVQALAQKYRSLAAAAEEAEKAESVAATLGDLEARVAELGKSEAELTLRTLEANGATEAQTERARELLALLEDAGENPLESWQDRLHETIAAALVDLGDFAGGARLLIADIGTQLAGIAAEGLLEGISALGEALAQGADGAASMQEALADMARQILEQLPTLFLNAGLTMIANGNWAVGLGLIAAAGVSAFSGGVVEGLYGDDDDDENENAKGGVYGPGGRMAFAKGGAFTNRIVTAPTEFRFARGGRFGRGLMGEAGPEAILPLRRMGDGSLGVASQGGGGGITVVINNYSQESVSAKEGQGADGMRQLEVTIGAVINGHISSGRADKALGGRYGLRAKGV